MDVQKVSELIEQKIQLLEKGRVGIEERGIAKANAIGEYEKAIAIIIMRLKNGEALECEGIAVQNPPSTLVEKIARGICFRERIEMEKAEALYKAHIVKMESVSSELNGYQSINRYLDVK